MNLKLFKYLDEKSEELVIKINRQRYIDAILYNKKYIPITKEETKTWKEHERLWKEFAKTLRGPGISIYEYD